MKYVGQGSTRTLPSLPLKRPSLVLPTINHHGQGDDNNDSGYEGTPGR